MTSLSLSQLRALGVVTLGVGASSLLLYAVRTNVEVLRVALRGHVEEVSELVIFLRMPLSPRRILQAQAASLTLTLLLIVCGETLWASMLVVPALSLKPLLQAKRAKRVSEIEAQLDGWLTGLAATLRATPSLGDAIEYSIGLVTDPLRSELDTLVKELRLGTSLERALVRGGERIGSHTVTTALGVLRIGQRTGGDIPRILECSASTLREMGRLEGVVRVKTAEGKAQASVLALLPFLVVALLNYIEPGFLRPLLQSFRGYAVIASSVVLWALSLVMTRRILDVDI